MTGEEAPPTALPCLLPTQGPHSLPQRGPSRPSLFTQTGDGVAPADPGVSPAKMQPADHMSMDVEYSLAPKRTSGGRYHSVTTWKGPHHRDPQFEGWGGEHSERSPGGAEGCWLGTPSLTPTSRPAAHLS